MKVPDYIIARLKKAKDEKREKEEGLQICIEMIDRLQHIEGVAGVHIMAVMWEEMVPFIAKEAKLLPRPTF